MGPPVNGGYSGSAGSGAAGRGAALKESMKKLLESKAKAKAEPKASSPSIPKPDAEALNQAFFSKMESDYNESCKSDGWDEVLKQSKEGSSPSVGEVPSSPSGLPEIDSTFQIPSDSDYFNVGIPAGKVDREIRCDPERVRKLLEQTPKKPGRNLDELRRVEAETREAMEQEKQRLASLPRSEPIRTKSDVVVIDSLDSDSEDEDPRGLNEVLRRGLAEIEEEFQKPAKKEKVNLDSLSDGEGNDSDEDEVDPDEDPETRRKRENAIAAMRALEEFDRIGREKEAMLAKYRDKYL